MNSGQDARRSFRIRETVYLKYDLITDHEFHEGLDRYKLRDGRDDGAQAMLVDLEARISEAMFMLRTESDQIGRLFTLLNDKINVVVSQLPSLKETRTALSKMPPQTCDVGADGMVFPTEKPLEVGTKLYLQFLLEADNRFVETLCHVVRLTESPDDADAEFPYGIAVEFHGMKAEQREILIQHLFSRESETLRMRRLELDAQDTG